MPNKRKPRQFKLLQGTARKDRDRPEFAPAALLQLPPAPEWLVSVDAVDAWDQFGDVLIAHRVLTEADLSLLAMLCAVHGDILKDVRAGVEVQPSRLAQYRLLASDFGLLPSSRSRVAPASNPLADNPFAQLDALAEAAVAKSHSRRKPRTDTNKGA